MWVCANQAYAVKPNGMLVGKTSHEVGEWTLRDVCTLEIAHCLMVCLTLTVAIE
jgi:hypothetical protein